MKGREMKFPLFNSVKLAKYIYGNLRRGIKRFPIVLMLEPTHLCNLRCKGCGRIHEYKDVAKKRLSVDECLASIEECGAPVVTVTGGEPLLHPDVDKIVSGALDMGKQVYLCTNATKLVDWLERFEPRNDFQINVHIDGPPNIHDFITGLDGAYEIAIEAIRKAKSMGYRVCTNTTIFKFSSSEDVRKLLNVLKRLGVDGILLSPGFNFDSNGNPVFMTKEEIKERFSKIVPFARRYPVLNSPIFFEFLAGRRDLKCTPWGNPTRNVKGWKSPCYMITNEHFPTFKELMENTDWEFYENKRDERCKHCMTHCGFEPTVALQAGQNIRDAIKVLSWTLFS